MVVAEKTQGTCVIGTIMQAMIQKYCHLNKGLYQGEKKEGFGLELPDLRDFLKKILQGETLQNRQLKDAVKGRKAKPMRKSLK